MSGDSRFGSKLRRLREAIGISQADFAEAMGVSRASISYYENGDRIPDIAFIQTVVEKTGCALEYLLGHSENMKEEYVDLGYITGLSDTAIDKLIDLISLSDVTTYLIEHPLFERFLSLLRQLTFLNQNTNLPISLDFYNELKSLELYNCLRDITNDMCEEMILSKYNPLDQLILKEAKLKAIFKEYEDCILEDCSRDEASLQEVNHNTEASKDADEERAKTDPIFRFYLKMKKP